VRVFLGSIETPFGEGLIAWTSRGVVALEAFVTGDEPGPSSRIRFREIVTAIAGDDPRDGRLPDEMRGRALEAIDGDARRAPLDLRPFAPLRREVYRAVTRIPRGSVASYADVARDIGRPRAWRAVGSALRRCPIDLLVPAHRVVHTGGTIGGGGASSIAWKRTLLRREGVEV